MEDSVNRKGQCRPAVRTGVNAGGQQLIPKLGNSTRSNRKLSVVVAGGFVAVSLILVAPAQASEQPVPTPSETTSASATPAPTASTAPTPSPSSPSPLPTATPVQPEAPSPVDRVWVLGTPSESFATQVQRSIAQNPTTAAQWVQTLSGLQSTLRMGQNISLPGSAKSVAEQLEQLDVALSGASTAAASRSASSASPQVAASTTYELRGYAINSNFTWQVNTEIDGAYCTPAGCQITDVTRQTWKISPGRGGDRFSFTSIRTGSGNLTQIYANLSVLCNGTQCATGSAGKTGPQDGSGSGSPVVTHASTAGGTIVDRVQMHAYFVPNGGTYYDSVKTGTAHCATGSNLNCGF